MHAEFIKATDSKRLIVFLDNVRSYQSVKDLIPRSATCLVIFTSNELLDHRIPSLELKALDPAPALKLFRQIAPSRAAAGTDSGQSPMRAHASTSMR